MRNNYTNNRFFCLLAVILLCGSCRKFVEIPPPTTSLISSTVFTSNATANSAQLSLLFWFANMSFNYTISKYAGLAADEFLAYPSDDQYDLQVYHNTMQINNYSSLNIWTFLYGLVYQSNAILEGVSSSTAIDDSLKRQLTGEAKFCRAYLYFHLVNLFGRVPLIMSTDYTKTDLASNVADTIVYDQIVADLMSADSLVNANYTGADGIKTGTEKLRPNKMAVEAMLAKVYLYRKDWSRAYAMSDKIISSQRYKLNTDLKDIFLMNSDEAILQAADAQSNTADAFWYNVYATSFPISPLLLQDFEAGDNRRSVWVDSVTSGSLVYYYPYKYRNQHYFDNGPVTEYCMLLRLTEQYMIRSEAQAEGAGDGLNGAIADLDLIRNRAGLSSYTGPVDQQSVLSAILHENRIEFFSEAGHRWYDLKRTGSVDSVMTRVNPLKGGTGWKTTQQLWPIPLTEMQYDLNLTQNPGY